MTKKNWVYQVMNDQMKYTRTLLTIFSVIVVLFPMTLGKANSQYAGNVFVAGGLSTIDLMGDNPSSLPMVDFAEWQTADPDPVWGGGYTGPQSGMGLAFTFLLDDEETYRVPIGLDYYFFHSVQRVPLARDITIHLKHTYSVGSLSLGFDYVYVRFPLAEAKSYVGVDTRLTLLAADKYTMFRNFHNSDDLDSTYKVQTKDDAFRLGGTLKLGIEGKIYDRWYLNINAGYSVMNLLLRDDERGELFTPPVQPETKENLVYGFVFRFFVQYRL